MIKILFLSANPNSTGPLRLDLEVRSIRERLYSAESGEQFLFEQEWALRVGDLQAHLMRHKPNIVHFSGHGSGSGEIILDNGAGESQPVPIAALNRLFGILKGKIPISCVVLNSCFSEAQATAIAESIDCVVGMSGSIRDDAAISFAASFYQALAFGQDLQTAFELACCEIHLENQQQQDVPKLIPGPSVNLSNIFLPPKENSSAPRDRTKTHSYKLTAAGQVGADEPINGSESEVTKFARILREGGSPGSPDSDWLWIVGTGVTAAATGNRPGATWLSLVKAAMEYLQSRQIDLGLLDSVLRDGMDGWKPDSVNLFAAVEIVAAKFPDHNAVQRWISDRMQDLEDHVADRELLMTLGEFSWPIATTNYDNILASVLTEDRWRVLLDLDVRQIEGWRRNNERFVLHLHGHHRKAESILFTKGSYLAYLGQPKFIDGMREVFRGRPVFIGCKDTLIDPSIGLAIQQQFDFSRDHGREPIVLHRREEQLDFKIAVQRVCYGERHEDLLPFLRSALAEIRAPGAANSSSVSVAAKKPPGVSESVDSGTWKKAYLTTIEENHRYLRLADFRTADREVLLPLDDIYVALVFDPRSAQERLEESRALHQMQADLALGQNVRDAFLRPIQGPGRERSPVTLADVLRDNATVVLLGDPGCGKTTLTHWLVRQCARARLKGQAEVVVEPLRLKADAEPSAGLQRVGPAWLPVLVSIQDYARRRADLGAEPRRRLRHYLRTIVLEQIRNGGEDADPEAVSRWLDAEASGGRLIILVDGLDESTNDDERRNIVEEVQFLRDWVLGNGEKRLRYNNRIVVTSRIAGYKHAPLSIDVPHYTVEPLKPEAIQRLMYQLFAAVGNSTSGDDPSPRVNLEFLRNKLLEQLREGPATITSLASSPVLASALFTFFLARQGALPEDRRELYRGVIDLFMRRERERLKLDDRTSAQLRLAFQELAFEAFNTPRSGLVSEERIRQKLSRLGDESIAPQFNSVFGPLVPKMPGEFGFIHRTFQEYLCAEFLTNQGSAFKELVSLAGMPSWSEPSRLAFMIWAKSESTRARRKDDVESLGRGSSLGNTFRPLALALAALAETTDPDAELFHELTRITIDALADSLPHWVDPPEDLADSLRRLCKQEMGLVAIEESIEESLRAPLPSEDTGQIARRAASAARLMAALDRFDPNLVEALQIAYPLDQEGFGWPITSALLRSVTPELASASSTEDWIAVDKTFVGRVGQGYCLSEAATYFNRHPRAFQDMSHGSAGARLLVGLLGGHRDYRLLEARELYQLIVAFLQLPDARRTAILLSLPVGWERIAKQHRKSGAAEDPVYELAVYLDTTGGARFRTAAAIPPTFQIDACVVPSRNWASVKQGLEAGPLKAATVSPVLDVCVNPATNRSLDSPEDRREALNLRYRLSDAARRALRNIGTDNASSLLGAVPEEHHVAVFDALAAVGSSLGELDPLSAFGEHVRKKPERSDAERVLNIERQAASCSIYQDDRLYSAAKWLDDRGPVTLGELCRARGIEANSKSDMPHLPPPYLGKNLEKGFQDDLTALERFPAQLDFLAEFSVTSILGKETLSFAKPELAAVMSRLPWVYADPEWLDQHLGFDPRKDRAALWRCLERAEDVWRLRARVRLLGALAPEARRNEERSIESELIALSHTGGLFVAQCAELFASRAQYRPVTVLIDIALSVSNLEPCDAASLTFRLLPLVSESSKAASMIERFFSIVDSIGDRRVSAELLHWASRRKRSLGEQDSARTLRIGQIDDPVQRAYADNQAGAVLCEVIDRFLSQDPFWGGEAAAPLLVYARLGDAISDTFGPSTPQLPGDPLRTVETAAQGRVEGDLVSAVSTASIIAPLGLGQLCQRYEAALLKAELDQQLKAVIAASEEGLGPQSVPGLVSALEADYDELRGRAVSLLLPPIEIKRDGSAGLSASGAGLETILELTEYASRSAPGAALPVRWRLERTILDSIELAEGMCDLAEGNRERSLVARRALEAFKFVTPDVQHALAERALRCSPILRTSLWILFSSILHFARGADKKPIDLPPKIFCGYLQGSPDYEFSLATPSDLVSALLCEGGPQAAFNHLTQHFGVSLSHAFSSQDADHVAIIAKVGASSFARTINAEERHLDFSNAAEALLNIDDGPTRAVSFLTHLANVSLQDKKPGSPLRSDLVVLLAGAAERSPARIVSQLDNPQSRKLIAGIARHTNSYPARRAAFLLMGHILDSPGRQPISGEIDALISVVLDVPDVIDAALSTSGRIRSLSSLGARKLTEILYHPSAARASLAGRMLIIIARNSEVDQDLRDRILGSIRDFIADPRSAGRVYFCGFDGTTPPAPTVREHLLEELSASGGGAVQQI
jgi:hypothetical protein